MRSLRKSKQSSLIGGSLSGRKHSSPAARTPRAGWKHAVSTQNEALGLWSMEFYCGKRTAVLVAKKIAVSLTPKVR
jgi:hypothetical protein